MELMEGAFKYNTCSVFITCRNTTMRLILWFIQMGWAYAYYIDFNFTVFRHSIICTSNVSRPKPRIAESKWIAAKTRKPNQIFRPWIWTQAARKSQASNWSWKTERKI